MEPRKVRQNLKLKLKPNVRLNARPNVSRIKLQAAATPPVKIKTGYNYLRRRLVIYGKTRTSGK
jgi:hypothetical protein